MAQSPLSRLIRGLERDLGFALLSRSSRGVLLTRGGEEFLTGVLALLERADDLVTHIRDTPLGLAEQPDAQTLST